MADQAPQDVKVGKPDHGESQKSHGRLWDKSPAISAKMGSYSGSLIIYTYEDGYKETRFFYDEGGGSDGVLIDNGYDSERRDKWEQEQRLSQPKPADTTPAPQTPDQAALTSANASKAQSDLANEQALNNERSWHEAQGHGRVTHAEYQRQQDAAETQARAKRDEDRQRELDASRIKAQEQANELAQASQAETARHNVATEKGKPAPIGAASDTDRYQNIFNPDTGGVTSVENPNYNEAKANAEQERQRIATEIAQRRMTLDEGVEQYKQWFDQNVKLPFMQAEEARARATEQRQALDAEERRRQFAANFSLQKGELGQKAAATAIQAEESLLPYRAGPTEAANMSSAINSLAAGGNPQGPSAAAGIHFSPTDFTFNAPDFKKIAADATKAAVGHLTNYRPSSEQYGTADYNAQPIAVPAYSYSGSVAPATAPVQPPTQ